MITNLSIKNFRSFSEASLDLDRLTILVGVNGSGKSTLVDALRFVRDALQVGLKTALAQRGGITAVRRWSNAEPPADVAIHITFTLDELPGFYTFALGSDKHGGYYVKEESFKIGRETQQISYDRPRAPADNALSTTALDLPFLASAEPLARRIYEFLTEMSFYDIIPDTLRAPQKPANPYPLEEDARNLSSALQALKQEHPPEAATLEAALARIIGDLEGYQVRPVGGYLVTELRHAGYAGIPPTTFDLSQESDGTLRVLGILAAHYQRPPRPLIALEEPEITIHPGALSRLWEEIQAAAEHSQVILTTHSPDLLDMSTAEQLRVVEKFQGISQVGPVATEQKQIIKKRLLSAGQLLRGQGLYRDEEG